MILVIIRMRVPSEKRTELSQTIASLSGSIGLKKGRRRCDFCQGIEDEDRLFLLEEWDTQENLMTHLKSEHFKVLRGVMNLLREPYERMFFHSLALLQTPMREMEWLIAKLFLGMILIFIAVIFLHLLGQFDLGNGLSYVAFIVVGSFCFSSYGILLGFLCRNQASARTLGVIFYLPHLLPSALSDFSQKLTAVAPFLPSYQFYEPIKSILLEEGRISNLSLEWIYLLLVGLLAFFFAYLLMKKRWLM